MVTRSFADSASRTPRRGPTHGASCDRFSDESAATRRKAATPRSSVTPRPITLCHLSNCVTATPLLGRPSARPVTSADPSVRPTSLALTARSVTCKNVKEEYQGLYEYGGQSTTARRLLEIAG